MRFIHALVCTALIFFGGFPAAMSQSNPTQMAPAQLLKYYQQAKASGMTDMQIEQAAMAQGFTLDDIAKLRSSLQNQGGSNPVNVKRDTSGVSRDQVSSSSSDVDRISSSSFQTEKQKRIFGSSFFRNASLTFEPNLRLATPKNYILGPDDELIVDIYGNSVDNFRLKISPEGTVKMLNLAPLYVNGLTIEQASERIVSRLRQAYSSLNRPGGGTYATITLGDVRSIKVVVTGEVSRPGSYTVSSLVTAFNALYLSGGPSENGSFRKIEIIRNNNVISKIDLYSFIVNADTKDNITLQDQDIIMVYPYQTRVVLEGEVKHEGIFEARLGETFQDIIRYAGGYTSNAYTATIRYRRNTGKEMKVGLITAEQAASFIPKDGDVFEIGKILNRYENSVSVEGAVYRPGMYAIEEGSLTVKELIAKAEGLREDAFLNRAVLQRKNEYLEPQIVSFNLSQLIRGEIEDIPLKRQDVLLIKSIDDLQEPQTVTIQGAVNKGGTFPYANDLTVSDLIFLAGGYSEGAIPNRIEVARRLKTDTLSIVPSQTTQIFTFDLDKDLNLMPENQQFRLKPFDVVFVRKSPYYEVQKSIVIEGEVRFPGRYAIINNKERITDMIFRAGGLKPDAYISGARLSRQLSGEETKNSRYMEEMLRLQAAESPNNTTLSPYRPLDRQLVGLDMMSILSNPSSAANILVHSGDSIYIPRRPETVRIVGEVLNPSIVNFDRTFSFNKYISLAGGYTDQARKSKVFVAYPNGRLNNTRHFLFFRSRPAITPGSVITIPAKTEKPARDTTPAERVAILSLLGTMILTLVRLF